MYSRQWLPVSIRAESPHAYKRRRFPASRRVPPGGTMTSYISRRGVLGGLSGTALLYASGATAQSAKLPTDPVALNVIDVAGNLQLTQAAIERFARENPKLVSRLRFSSPPSPELPGKLKAQQQANKVDIDLVLRGPGAMSDGIQQDLWVEVWKSYAGS